MNWHACCALLGSLLVSGGALAVNPEPAAVDLGRLSLAAAQELLQQHGRELRVARRAIDAAQAGVLIAGARPNPNLTVQTSNINPQAGIGPGAPRDKAVDTQLRVDYLVERGNKRDLRLANAAELEKATREDLSDALRVQGAAVANAYYDLLLGQEKALLATETASLFGATLAASERRLQAGDASSTDVDRIRVDTLRAQGDERSAAVDRRHAQSALAALLGIEADAARIVASDAWPAADYPRATSSLDERAALRPDVRAARARVDAALHARELARSLRTRDVSVGVTYDHWPQNGNNFQGTGNSYGVSVSVPLFFGNHYDGEIARAESDWAAALDALDKVTAVASAELAHTDADLASARERLARYDRDLVVAAQRVAEAQEFAYRKGAISVLDLLDARRTLRSVQQDAATARADYAKALVAWEYARP
ncbi:MAG TPA: TolC family protein [Casimicrobiaceae bacterium]